MLRIVLISLFGLVAGAPFDQQKSTCEVCYSLVNELQDYLTTSQSKTSIEDYVKDICTKLPSEEKDICLGFTRDYTGLFFAKLNSDLTPHQLCDKIPTVCPDIEEEEEKTDEDVNGPVQCAICELAVLGIDGVVKEGTNSATIGTALGKFCDGLPEHLSATCKKIEREIQAGLTQGFDHKTVCRFGNLCPADTDDTINYIQCEECQQAIDAIGITDTERICKHLASCNTRTKKEVLIQPSVKDDAACEICKLIVTYLDQILQDNKTIATVNSTLYAFCSGLPDPWNTTCFGIVPLLEQQVTAGFDPKTACTATNFCPKGISSSACELCMETADRNKDGKLNGQLLDATCTKLCNNRQRRSVQSQASISKPCHGSELECKNIACTACKLLVDGINGIIGANFTVETVDKTVTDICNRMAGESTQDACLRAVPKIVELLERGVSPEDACKIVGLCSQDDQMRSSSKRTALRTNKKKVLHTSAPEAIELNDELECELCKELGNVINWLLKDNITETTVNSTLYSICINLPATELQNLCLSAGPKILQAMKNGIDVADVCVIVKMCEKNEEGTPKMSHTVRSVFQRPVQVNLRCDTCKFVVEELDKILADNATDEKINSTVYGVCAKLQGAFMDLCLEAAPKLVETLVDGVDRQSLCMLIKLCDNDTAIHVEEPQPQQVDLKCDACEFIISELNKVLADNATDVKINSTVFSICTQLTGAFEDLCLQAAPQVINTIEKGADVNKTCVLVKLCNGTTAAVKPVPAVLKANPLECGICEFVIKELDSLLQKNSSYEKINDTVYELCEKLVELKNQCFAFAPKLVSAIATGVDPKEVCSLVRLCDSQVVQAKTVQLKMDSNLECDLCKYLIDEIDKRIVTNATDKKINETVYKLCENLDSSLKAACLLLAPSIVEELEKGADAETVCEKIGACKSSAEEMTPEETAIVLKAGDTTLCAICKIAIEEIDKELKMNTTEQKINSTVYGLCNRLDGTLKTLCLGIAPQLIETLENGADPDTACTAIKLCNATTDVPVSFDHRGKKHYDCEMCQKSLQHVYKNIEQDYPKVEGVLMQICEQLPVNYRTVCVSMLEEDNGRMFKSVLQSYTPVSMCEMAECIENHDNSEFSNLS